VISAATSTASRWPSPDYLAIALAELGNIASRLMRLTDEA
jgi:hypothetical protein